ncbi:MAG: hypothetical protein GYA55_02080, partial [SAR324 cluster bacterium]|nr:hypothetical protein [SAR324 cluster bacterium]
MKTTDTTKPNTASPRPSEFEMIEVVYDAARYGDSEDLAAAIGLVVDEGILPNQDAVVSRRIIDWVLRAALDEGQMTGPEHVISRTKRALGPSITSPEGHGSTERVAEVLGRMWVSHPDKRNVIGDFLGRFTAGVAQSEEEGRLSVFFLSATSSLHEVGSTNTEDHSAAMLALEQLVHANKHAIQLGVESFSDNELLLRAGREADYVIREVSAILEQKQSTSKPVKPEDIPKYKSEKILELGNKRAKMIESAGDKKLAQALWLFVAAPNAIRLQWYKETRESFNRGPVL